MIWQRVRRLGAPTVCGISLVYVTCRREPHFDWFVDGLMAQIGGDEEVELVLVDAQYSESRRLQIEEILRGRIPLIHVPPKPTPLSGEYRLTSRDYFTAASARNTGLIYSSKDYVVFIDDASVIMPQWWSRVLAAAQSGYVVAGAYQKHWEMEVKDGVLLRSRSLASGIDPRWDHGSDRKLTRLTGGEVFGASLGIPRKLALEANGFDELCDPIGGEDYQFDIRIQWLGGEILYDRRMLTIESEELHREDDPPLRIDKLASENEYMDRLAQFGVYERRVPGRCDSSHMLLDVLYGTGSTKSLGNYYELRTVTPLNVLDIIPSMPSSYWFDGTHFKDM